MSNDYIPAPDADADSWFTNFAVVVAADPTAVGLELADSTTISAATDEFTDKLTLATDPATRTPVAVAAKDEARRVAETTVRPFAQLINANPAVTDQQRVSLGLTVRKTTPTPTPPPASAPVIEFRASQFGYAKLGYTDSANPDGKAKPAGSIGVQVFADDSETPGDNPLAGRFMLTATKSPFSLPADGAAPGASRRIWFRYVTTGGPAGIQQTGPFSAPLDYIIT